MDKWIYSFEEGRAEDKALLGGKGANLAEMTHLELPVPEGFTITTQSCLRYLETPSFFESILKEEVLKAVTKLETKTNKFFMGNEPSLLLVSVRSGAKISMPGMMDTILNLGLNDLRVQTLADATNANFAYNCYRRLLQMFADVVYGIPKEEFDQCLEKTEKQLNKKVNDFSKEEHQSLIQQYKEVYQEHYQNFPQSPKEQLYAAIKAVFKSWNNPRAKVYRELNQIPHDLGTAVNVQSMVFGNSDQKSGTGVVFTRNPATGEPHLFGEFLLNAQGEDVVAGIRTPEPIDSLKRILPQAYEDFCNYAKILEKHYKDMQDIEFTIEKEKLYILQTRNGKRTAKASLKIALDLVNEKMISKQEALLRVSPSTIDQLIHPVFEEKALTSAHHLTQGLPASPGAATGEIVFTAESAKEFHALGKKVILVRQETSPEDIEGMVVSQAIVTSHGGMTSHAAVVARGMGTCCVAGCGELSINEDGKTLVCGKVTLKEGDILSVDGTSGKLYIGSIPTTMIDNNDELQMFLSWADEIAQLTVRANAETIQDLKTAVQFGAKGIGLARTEHMFFGEERILEMRRLILSTNEIETKSALMTLLAFQEEDFYQMYQTIQDKPMIVRLLDPPMHEFLPKTQQEIEQLSGKLQVPLDTLTRKITSLQETNPMLGHRGCRLGITQPEIYKMQVEAVFNSAIRLAKEGMVIKPEIMIPLIAEKAELVSIKTSLCQHIDNIFKKHHMQPFPYEIGTMIELPRTCFIADQLAEEADFFSFGTNDLTQMTYGFSRDDIGKFIQHYKEGEIMSFDPFQTIDRAGVGELMKIAISKAHQVKPELPIGICGEVGGDPASIPFFQEIGITYVSCSPYRVPAARLAVAQAHLF
ncbi:pyruvate, phosphate dikinase [Streptococcus anginosus]|jgi:pyruvate,orthophosphate dikinase|uniref:pyruvate, phosphate dikinase n=1 Tax=Streptococcus TaxID=1301 RepID=UPI0008A95396|nr:MULTISPECIES: pyruvate, phosphate dikinase [Streptococcus]KAA9306847.1 pyruvate, phosphate dikinase [Streptococcus anginosus]MCW0934192.1 pyruvate, phosphate dikinase [Streptococcus anginosus]MCW0995460.1 pyruvate, phosphate dikinase [Streptococcus anginosus]MCW1001462.1 pyruvate, phosphate dikinase [Streptococcus anginosus]MCW1028429.1 pyruvate, phosphate dikinase [Streptococcus anginosus]